MAYSKYKAKPTIVDGIRFASKAEARRYTELKILERARKIESLELQPKFQLHAVNPMGEKRPVFKYMADFKYIEDGEIVIEDVKGKATPVFKMKAKMFQIEYPRYDFRITK